ncbi:Siderophore iron transporter [Lachnellula occidentalis]|uniref:Siderophore iron transporter n=1 Tax=Lachnellula occidentalis TaxID=215460 RepID=A0A8H8UDR9_9HELO|nr:Siderophore iron transporter [Lachnellula occidentalis]
MKFFDKHSKTPGTEVATSNVAAPESDIEDKHVSTTDGPDVPSGGVLPDQDVQDGVKKAQAITLSWTKKELIVAYACVLLVFFVNSMQQQIQNNLGVYVTSAFLSLPLYGTTSIVSGIVGGVIKLPAAKFIDLIGRAEGFAIFTLLATMGGTLPSLQR